jgi:predicted enzyme related to lactoylglutathione lyase
VGDPVKIETGMVGIPVQFRLIIYSKEFFMNQGLGLLVYPVKDIAQAKALYSKLLGIEPYYDGPYYVGFKVGDLEIGLDPNGHNAGLTGPIGYWQVNDIQKSLQVLLDAGAQVQQGVKDVGGGMLIAWVKDADGNITGLRQLP